MPALALVGYLAIARGVENLYPFSTFNMYSVERAASASRVLARDAHGAVSEVTGWERWECDAPPDLDAAPCRALGRF